MATALNVSSETLDTKLIYRYPVYSPKLSSYALLTNLLQVTEPKQTEEGNTTLGQVHDTT